MRHFKREDGTMCQARKFEGYAKGGADALFEITSLFHSEEDNFKASWIPEESTDVWEEDEYGEPYEIINPEHIETVNDKLNVGDYVVIRDGAIYVMAGSLFEAIWEPVISNDPEEWNWHVRLRLPYQTTTGFWQHKDSEDIVSTDGGMTHFMLSERPKYHLHGPIYISVNVDG